MNREPQTESGYLLLADISGYTSFLSKSELDHAHEIVSEFIELISARLRVVGRIIKLEGDAVFANVPDGTLERGDALLEAVEDTYAAFRHRTESVSRKKTCSCRACGAISTLDLKFLIHHGSYVRRNIAGTPDLVGPEVIVAHRLLKNSVQQKTGWPAYVLMTESAAGRIGIDPISCAEGLEEFEHVGSVKTLFYDLHKRYDEISAERPSLREIGKPHLVYTVDIDAPAAAVWQWLNDPLKRSQTDNATITISRRSNGRLKEGAVLHCAHGKQVDVEEIVEWRPCSSYALRHYLPGGHLLMVHDLHESASGVRLEVRMKLIFNLRMLRPLAPIALRLASKMFRFNEQFDNTRRMANEDWKTRLN